MMTEKKSYAGIDYFRLIAALLIISIHTSPFVSFSQIGDFMSLSSLWHLVFS